MWSVSSRAICWVYGNGFVLFHFEHLWIIPATCCLPWQSLNFGLSSARIYPGPAWLWRMCMFSTYFSTIGQFFGRRIGNFVVVAMLLWDNLEFEKMIFLESSQVGLYSRIGEFLSYISSPFESFAISFEEFIFCDILIRNNSVCCFSETENCFPLNFLWDVHPKRRILAKSLSLCLFDHFIYVSLLFIFYFFCPF